MEIEALRLNSPCQTVAKGNALGRPARPHSLVLVQISHPVAHSTELRTLGLRPFLQDLSVCKEQFPSLSFLGSHGGVKGIHVHVEDAAGLFLFLTRAIPGAPSASRLCLACVFGPAHGIDLRHRKCCRVVATLRRHPACGAVPRAVIPRVVGLTQAAQRGSRLSASRSRLPDKADRNAVLTRTSKPKGEGRHVITDALGLFLGAGAGPASDTGGQCLPDLLQRLLGKAPRLKVVFADGGYDGSQTA
ncbi:hypothetical protein GGP72_003208 [Salinibacter ruber]|uniref:Transposase IS4-like domain-containing protein n=1 Tax=Salinibacter ruber TaxID=146919 RepID=A0A9X2Q108_9BACT|nr:hypothetical protein [Salinibacter ruber]MCS3682546.1 hypothetical protein [Salinibacter ruber]